MDRHALSKDTVLLLEFLKGVPVVFDGINLLPSTLNNDAMNGDAKIYHLLDQVRQIRLFESARTLEGLAPVESLGVAEMSLEDLSPSRRELHHADEFTMNIVLVRGNFSDVDDIVVGVEDNIFRLLYRVFLAIHVIAPPINVDNDRDIPV